jgi:hypothetical protein
LPFHRNQVSRSRWLAGVGTSFAIVLAAAAVGAIPARAADASAVSVPVSNVHIGQVLSQVPRSGTRCAGKPATPVHITVQATRAHPNAYVNVALNARCQLVVTKIAYGVEGKAGAGHTSSKTAASVRASTAEPATSKCNHETHAVITELSGAMNLTVVQLTTYAHYTQYCNGGNMVSASASEVTYEPTWGMVGGYTVGQDYVKMDWVRTSSVKADAGDFVSYDPMTTVLAAGAIEAVDTSYPNGVADANCYWDKALQTGTSDNFGCSAGINS